MALSVLNCVPVHIWINVVLEAATKPGDFELNQKVRRRRRMYAFIQQKMVSAPFFSVVDDDALDSA